MSCVDASTFCAVPKAAAEPAGFSSIVHTGLVKSPPSTDALKYIFVPLPTFNNPLYLLVKK